MRSVVCVTGGTFIGWGDCLSSTNQSFLPAFEFQENSASLLTFSFPLFGRLGAIVHLLQTKKAEGQSFLSDDPVCLLSLELVSLDSFSRQFSTFGSLWETKRIL